MKHCKYIRREGESCTLNNNCDYPICKQDKVMRTILEWKCGYCGSIQKSDSSKRWQQDFCECGESAVDLEQYYQINVGSVEVVNTTVFGEISDDKESLN